MPQSGVKLALTGGSHTTYHGFIRTIGFIILWESHAFGYFDRTACALGALQGGHRMDARYDLGHAGDYPRRSTWRRLVDHGRTATAHRPVTRDVSRGRLSCHYASTERDSLNVSESVEGLHWHIYARVGRNETPLFSRDWLDNGEDMRRVSASIDALQTARN